ncbi:MAG: ArsR/SmtB family transcription factor [Cyanobacteriota bacterium]
MPASSRPAEANRGRTAREEEPDPLTFEQAQPLLRALADPIRLRVVEALGAGERCVCDLTTNLELAQPKLSFHLKVMKEAGLISARQQGRWIYYRLEPTPLLRLRDWLDQLAKGCATPAQPCS